MIKKGTCPICNKGPRDLRCRHPETGQWICPTCYGKASATGICPECKKGPRVLCYLHPETKRNICHGCSERIKCREAGLRRVPRAPKKPVKPVAAKKHRRKLYPTRESVIKALETRARDGKKNSAAILYSQDATLYRRARKFGVSLPEAGYIRTKFATRKKAEKPARLPETHKTPAVVPSLMSDEDTEKRGRKTKYLTRAAVIADLEVREAQGEENFPSVLCLEDSVLYRSAQKLGVELPTKKNSWGDYSAGDLVQNQNPKDLSIYGKIGRVIESSEQETRVNFKEGGKVTRVYKKWWNLNNITLYARLLVPLKTIKTEAVLV